MKEGESLAVWTLKGTSFSDNGTRVVCQQSKSPDAPAAILHVYGKDSSYSDIALPLYCICEQTLIHKRACLPLST